MTEGPLAGIRVLEVGVAMASPFCGMVLADQGADVIKIERVDTGDDSRSWPPFFNGTLSHYYAAVNRNKRSVALDLKSEHGAEVLRRLASQADVLVENFRVGALERAGLGYDALSALNPRLVYCSISGFGRTGPRGQERANDLFMQAFSGGMSVTGEENGIPVKMGISVADIGAGMYAAIGILSALQQRHRTGRGQHVNISLLGGQLAMLSYQLTSYFSTGVVPKAMGSGTGFGVPYQAFPAADDAIIVATFNQKMWRELCLAMQRPEWIDHPRYQSMELRRDNRAELLAALTEVFRSEPAEYWEQTLKTHGIPCTRINRIDQVIADPQVEHLGLITEVDVAGVGPVRMAGSPLEFSDAPRPDVVAPPRLGQHSHAVLRESGWSDGEIAALQAEGAIGLDAAGPSSHPDGVDAVAAGS